MTNPTLPADGDRPRAAAPIPVLVLAAGLLAAGCVSGGSDRALVRTAPVASLSDAVECARERGEEMGFDAVRFDEEDHLLVLEREDEDVRRSDPKFQRAVDQVRVEPAGGEPGADRPLRVTARTYYEYFTRRGRTRRQREASPAAVEAAGTLLEACAGGGTAGG